GTSLITDPKQLEQMLMNGSDPQLVTVGKEIWLEAEQQEETPQRKPSSWIKFIVLSALALLLVLIFTPTDKNPFYIWFGLLNDSLRLAVKLIQYSLIALLISIILTPLESLSWWAGWYGVQPLQNPGQLVSEACPDTPINHYVVYLDGINQGSYQYLPEVERFLDDLAAATPDH
ncbi:MAG: peptidase, partial [Planktothrix sp.]